MKHVERISKGEKTLILRFAGLCARIIVTTRSDYRLMAQMYSGYLEWPRIYRESPSRMSLPKRAGRVKTFSKMETATAPSPLKKNFLTFNNKDLLSVIVSVMNRNNGFVLHASSLVRKGLGYIFVGKKGAGKSTVRQLFPDLLSLGDDLALVRKEGHRYNLFGSPVYQRANRIYPNKKVRIAGVFELVQAEEDFLERLSFTQAVNSIVKHAFVCDKEPRDRQGKILLVKTCADFCQKVRCYKLFFTKSRKLMNLISKS